MTGEKKGPLSVKQLEQQQIIKSGRLITLSSYFVVSIALLSYLGYRLDGYLGNKKYYGTMVGALLGFSWSMYETIKLVQALNKGDSQDKEDSQENGKQSNN